MKHFCTQKKRYGVRCVRRGLDFCHFPAKKVVVPMHGYRSATPNPNLIILCSQTQFGSNHTHNSKKRGGENLPPKDCVGLFAGQKWCISGNPGNTLSGHHLSVRGSSVCFNGMPCQVLWFGLLGLGGGGQRQLRLLKNIRL